MSIKGKGGEFEIVPARKATHAPLDEVIRALDEGDGASIAEHGADIAGWLKELRRYRETITCSACARTVIGRHPVCLDCYEASVRKLIGDSLRDVVGNVNDDTTRERIKAKLRTILERKIGR